MGWSRGSRETASQSILRVLVVMALVGGLVATSTPTAQAAATPGVERGDVNTTGTNGTSVAVADTGGSQVSGTWTGSASPSESVSNVAGFILALKPGSSSAINFRSAASSSTGSGSGVASFNATAPSGVQAGDLIIAFQGGRSPGTITPPDSSWRLGRSIQPSSGHHFWYWKIAGPAEPATYQWQSSAATKWAFVIVAYSGVDPANPIHAESGHVAAGSGTAVRSTPALPTSIDTWLVSAFAHRSTHNNASWGSHSFAVDSSPPGVCGASGSSTVCVTVPEGTLNGQVPIKVTSSGNGERMYVSWAPTGRPTVSLITKRGPSPATNDYSFVWPTTKYLDGSGVLQVRAGSPTSAPVSVPATLSNGNVSDFQHSPSNWATFLPPTSWTLSRDPVVATVGDGASDEPLGNNLVESIANSNPDLFLYLGDIYEEGTFTENLNHYGRNSMDGGAGTLWGQLGAKTQPTLGNHEADHVVDWQDYWHGRPLYTSFRFGNVLFFDLASDVESMSVGSPQYNYVQGILESPTAPPPPCIVTFFHRPTLQDDGVSMSRLPMWSLLTNNGGDIVLNGHSHTTVVHKPLNDQMEFPSPSQPTMVQMIFGAGGTGMGSGWADEPRIDWKLGGTAGATYMTLNGARNGGTPTSLSWTHKDTAGNVLRSGTRDCSGQTTVPAPSITGFSPTSGPPGTSVTLNGSGFTGATQVTFNSVPATFAVNSDSQITATVPETTSGQIRVTTPGGSFTTSTSFTVTPPPPSNVAPSVNAGADQTTTLPGPVTLNGSVTDDGLPAGAMITQSWSTVSAPAGAVVTFSNPTQATTSATFSNPGVYVLRLTASDTQLTASDDVMVSVAGEYRAVSQSTRYGTTTGSIEAGYSDDGVYQTIREQPYGGNRARLEHTWTFQLGGGDTIRLELNAFRSGSENFTFSYSLDGRTWTPMVVVTAPQDGTSYVYTMPQGLSGSVSIMVADVNRNKGDTVLDTVTIDRIVVVSQFN